MRNVLSKGEVDKLYSKMREKGVSASQICKALNIHYQCFRAMTLEENSLVMANGGK